MACTESEAARRGASHGVSHGVSHDVSEAALARRFDRHTRLSAGLHGTSSVRVKVNVRVNAPMVLVVLTLRLMLRLISVSVKITRLLQALLGLELVLLAFCRPC